MGDSFSGGKSTSLLTAKQKGELYADFRLILSAFWDFRCFCLTDRLIAAFSNQAMLDYLQTSGFTAAYEALNRESGVEDDPKQKGVLEKKWASIVRLQRKVRAYCLDLHDSMLWCCIFPPIAWPVACRGR